MGNPISDFWLVQRLSKAWEGTTRTGFDGLFECEYMGSAEFEWGAIPESLTRIRKSDVVVCPVTITNPEGTTKVVYFVGSLDKIEEKIEDFKVWFSEENPQGKERSFFPENFKDPDRDGYFTRTVAWWSLRNDLMWTLTPENAERLVNAIGQPALWMDAR